MNTSEPPRTIIKPNHHSTNHTSIKLNHETLNLAANKINIPVRKHQKFEFFTLYIPRIFTIL
jgi:hypothetical protein